MLKFIMTNPEGRKILGLIITKENVDNLLNDQPIHFYSQQMNMDKIEVDEVVISYFETIPIAINFLKERGFNTNNIKIEPKVRQ